MCDFCGSGWRFDLTKLGGPDAGQVKAVLHPVAAEFEELYSQPSTGSISLATRDVAQADIWPDTGIYISQVMPDGSRRGRFGGYFPKNSGSGGGALTVSMESIDGYLSNRLIAGTDTPFGLLVGYTEPTLPWSPGVNETFVQVGKPTLGNPTVSTPFYSEGFGRGGEASIAAFLVRLARGGFNGDPINGIPTLTGVADPPNTKYPDDPTNAVQAWNWWDFKNIGEALKEMVTTENGIKYWLEHVYANGYWFTIIHFSDVIGTERDYVLKSDREGWQYGLEVDGTDKTSRLYGLGSGEESTTMFSIAYDSGRDTDYPERQRTQAWKDIVSTPILDGLTKGYVADHRDPTTVPAMTIVGLPDYDPDAEGYDPQKGFPAPEICRPGDTFGVDIGYGAVTVKDIRVRNLGVSWSLKEGAPVERVLAMQPVVRPALSVKTQVPSKPPGAEVPVTSPTTADPWPTPGVLSTIRVPTLTEISGMEVSRANPGFVWVHDDELDNPQVVLVNMKNGRQAASFTPSPGVSGGGVGDPEAIRLARSTGKLVLADTGDNALSRPTSGTGQPHLIVLPEPKGAGNKGTLVATRYPVAYPNGERVNVETLLIHPTSEQVYLVSKEATRARVFSYGPLSSMSTVNNVGTLVATLNMPLVSDGTHSYTGQFILFRQANKTGTVVLKQNWRYAGTITTPAMNKSEAIAVVNSCAFVTTSEGPNPPLYQVLIDKAYGATCSTPAGPVGGGGTPSNPNITVPGQLINMSNWKLQLPI